MNTGGRMNYDNMFYKGADDFFQSQGVGLAFDDALLVPHHSSVAPQATNPTSRLTDRITLSTPLISSDMDTVTESKMAIQMALHGGIGMIHSNLTPEQQAEEVTKVKKYVHGIIRTPVFVKPDQTIAEILAKKSLEGLDFSTFPVLDDNDTLIGLLGSKAVKERFEDKDVQDMMKSGDGMVTIQESNLGDDAIKTADNFFTNNPDITKLLIVDKNGTFKGLIMESDVYKIKKDQRSEIQSTRDTDHRLMVGATAHMMFDTDGKLDRKAIQENTERLIDAGVDIIAASTAHGDTETVGDMLQILREVSSDIDIMAGNVTTQGGVEFLAKKGANTIKIGQGPGSICTTRTETGIGVPQLTANYVCSRAAGQIGGITTIADGGIAKSGDIAKALTVADAAMVGSFVAGTLESPGEVIMFDGKQYKIYRGMGSTAAMEAGSSARYGDRKNTNLKLSAEGIEGVKPFKGPVSPVILRTRESLKATLGYLGAENMQTFKDNARYIRTTPAAVTESGVHDVIAMNT